MNAHHSRVQVAFLRSLEIFYPCDGCVGPTGELCRKQNGFIMCAALQPKHVTSVEWGSGQRKGHVELVCA